MLRLVQQLTVGNTHLAQDESKWASCSVLQQQSAGTCAIVSDLWRVPVVDVWGPTQAMALSCKLPL